jgi:membrane protease YdiL (CAAX protease family)
LKKFLQRLSDYIHTPEPVPVPWNWPLGAALVVIFMVVFVISIFVSATAAEVPLDEIEPGVIAWGSFLASALMLVFTMQYTSAAVQRARTDRAYKFTLTDALALTPSRTTPFWVVVLTTFGLAIIVDAVGLVAGVPAESLPLPMADLSSESSSVFLLGAFVTVLLAPAVQELIFRGVLYPALLKQFSPWQSLIISAIAFVLIHFLLDTEYIWWGIAYPLAITLTAGIVRASTKSTLAAFGAHSMFGLFIVLRAILID